MSPHSEEPMGSLYDIAPTLNQLCWAIRAQTEQQAADAAALRRVMANGLALVAEALLTAVYNTQLGWGDRPPDSAELSPSPALVARILGRDAEAAAAGGED